MLISSPLLFNLGLALLTEEIWCCHEKMRLWWLKTGFEAKLQIWSCRPSSWWIQVSLSSRNWNLSWSTCHQHRSWLLACLFCGLFVTRTLFSWFAWLRTTWPQFCRSLDTTYTQGLSLCSMYSSQCKNVRVKPVIWSRPISIPCRSFRVKIYFGGQIAFQCWVRHWFTC